MRNWEEEIQQEQKRVSDVVHRINISTAVFMQQIGEAGTDISGLRKTFWDDVTVNLDNPDDLAETYISIRQQTELLSERERRQDHSRKQLKLLKKLKYSTYFGRIDFMEAGETETDQVYIGIGSFYDDESDSFLVHDWRAPISSVYYDYLLGPAHYDAPAGGMEGTLTLKRQYIIKEGKIVSMFDAGITIGDELLKEVLGSQADSQMKSIVATIQKEQNLIIRDERSKLLIVQGSAGSGKTSSALQRIAFLLYRDRNNMNADQILLFSPNALFNSYVSNVLPELGEENMQQTTFEQYLLQFLQEDLKMESLFSQMEYVLATSEDPGYLSRLQNISFKSSLAFLKMIEEYLLFLKKDGMLFKDIIFRGRVLISNEELKELFYEEEQSIPIPNRLALLSEKLLRQVRKMEINERKQSWVEEEMQYLDKEDYLKSYRKALKVKNGEDNDDFSDSKREEVILSSYIVKKSFKPIYRQIKTFGFLDVVSIYKQLFVDKLSFGGNLSLFPETWDEICLSTVRMLDGNELYYEDATPLLFLKEGLEEGMKNTGIRHVFIDEAQDYSPFQFAFIKKVFPNSKMTVLGDSSQTIFAHGNEFGMDILSELFQQEETRKIELTKSYRSTREIVEFTKSLLIDEENITPFNRPGVKPEITICRNSQLKEAVITAAESLRERGHESIAVICRTEGESVQAYQELKDSIPLKLIRQGRGEFEEGIVVIPSYLAKGIEFDAVIIYNGSEAVYNRESERKLFYTACTRAMHELYIVSAGALTSFADEASKSLANVRYLNAE
ncbi:RNA polymerase recycling motor HelD [Bacillus sp. MUM 13]|uniref:RNA polymerase recycling motor HelD n=1 Tax=Bacillus sp. MUM 13 TaxID=1678001 RepID=UPI0008F5BCEA|nr:RNA polymerase recycling motor HelD [Bacillus sp. MUM 13]OIK13661.1 helicase [Bacillus sp. MUM 13]